MTSIPRVVIAVAGAGALITSVMSNALASRPPGMRGDAHTLDKKFTLNGSYKITGVLRVQKNNSVYGRLYAHGGQQVWQGLLVHSGGVQTDALEVTGTGPAILHGGANISGNLQADTISTTGAVTVGGKLTTSDLTTTGTLTAGAINATSLTTTGGLTASQLSISASGKTALLGIDPASGALTVNTNVAVNGNINATNLSATGTVDFSNATVKLPSTFGGGIGSAPATLTIGTTNGTTAPLTIIGNNKSTSLGVNSSGALTTTSDLAVGGGLAVGGNLSVGGNGITAASLTAPNAANTTNPGTLTLTGGTVNVNGTTNLNGDVGFAPGHNVNFTVNTSGTNVGATHIVANGDLDVAGTTTVGVNSGTGAGTAVTQNVSFITPFTRQPIVVLTPAGDPAPGGDTPPKVWVTPITGTATNNSTTYTGFQIHYVPQGNPSASSYQVSYNYNVIGS